MSLPKAELARRVRCVGDLDRIPNIPPAERAKLKKVAERYVFRANDYYLGLLNWDDPADGFDSPTFAHTSTFDLADGPE